MFPLKYPPHLFIPCCSHVKQRVAGRYTCICLMLNISYIYFNYSSVFTTIRHQINYQQGGDFLFHRDKAELILYLSMYCERGISQSLLALEIEDDYCPIFKYSFCLLYNQNQQQSASISSMIKRLRSQISGKKLNRFMNLLVFLMICITALNLYGWLSNQRSHQVRKISLAFYDTKVEEYFTADARRRISNKFNIFKETQPQLNIHLSKNLLKKRIIAQKRVNLGRPQVKTSNLLVYIIKSSKHTFLRSHSCSIISSINSVSKITVESIQSLLINNAVSYIILLTKPGIDNQLHQNIGLLKMSGYDVQKTEVLTDSQYKFISPYVEDCSRIVYTFGNSLINNQMALSITQQTKKVRDFSLFYSAKYLKNQKEVKSLNLSNVSLSSIDPIQFYRSLYIFDSKFLSIITPLNFAYYSKYTLEQILLIPVLAIVQQSGMMFSSQKIMFSMTNQFIQFSQFAMISTMQQKNSMCFVSYPSNPFIISMNEFDRYIKQILKQKSKSTNITVIAYFPYRFGTPKDLMSAFKKLYQINQSQKQKIQRIRFRIKENKAVGSLAVYQSAYYFCPNKSLIVSSRHNVLFSQIFTIAVSKNLVSKFHYYHTDYESFDQSNKNFSVISPNYLSSNRPRTTNLFHQVFRHFQIFKSDFLKTHVFYTLKSAEVDFYQTEASFATPLIEVVNWRIGYIKKKLVTVLKRQYTQTENNQIKYINSYTPFDFLIANQLNPYMFSCLQNQVYKRFATLKMPQKIHQIWITNSPITDIRWALRQTIVKNNPGSQVLLWKLENITKQAFPISYQIAQRTLQYHKTSKQSYYALAADVLRYEVLYQNGGIYIDFKMEGLKSMINFFKYEVFFIDNDISWLRFNRPQAIGNGIMGGTQNNYFLKILLTELILPQGVKYQKSIPFETGSFVARKTLNDQQFFKILGLSFHLLLARPYVAVVSACGGENKTFDADQKVYEVLDYETQKIIKIGLPCKQYPQSYLTTYSPLSKTWLFQKRSNIN